MVEALLRDVTLATRALLAKSGWTSVAVLSLAIGIGATTVVFSIVESVLLRPFPYPRPHEIVLLQGSDGPNSAADLAAIRDQSTTLAALGLLSRVELKAPDGSLPVATAAVSRDVFQVLGVSPAFGPGFPSRDDSALAEAGRVGFMKNPGPDVVILGYGFWQQRYGGDPSIVGRTLRLGGVPHQIVGVMPRDFFFPEPDVQLWTPLGWPGIAGFTAVARLRPDTAIETAQAEIEVITRRLDGRRPSQSARTITVTPIRDAAVSRFGMVLWLLLGAVALVLFIGCANVANLLLARSAAREKELAVRAILGASRPALVRQLVVESVLLAGLGGAIAIGLAFGGLRVVLGLGLVEIPRMEDATINVTVLAFAVLVSLATGLLAGVAPAVKASGVNLTGSLKQGGSTSSQSGSSRLRDLLVVAEVAFAVPLLVGAGLLVRSAVAMSQIDWGFNPDRLALVAVSPPVDLWARAAYLQRMPGVVEPVLNRLRALPDVVAAGAATTAPFVRNEFIYIGERVVADGAAVQSAVTAVRTLVTPGYLAALGGDLHGRDFDVRDDVLAPKSVVLSQSLAQSLFPDREAIGQIVHLATLKADAPRIGEIGRDTHIDGPFAQRRAFLAGGSEDINHFEVTGATAYTVIGVAPDLKVTNDAVTPWGPAEPGGPAVYLDVRQFHDQYAAREDAMAIATSMEASTLRSFAIRTQGAPGPTVEAARAAITEQDPMLSLAVAAPMRTLVAQSLGGAGESGLLLALSTVFGALSLMLAAAGIYGVISHAVSQRVYEIGVRLAIGASPSDVRAMVLAQGLRLASIGLVIGLSVASAGSRTLESRLFGVRPTDPVTFVGVALFLLGIAAAASFVPAQRAAQVDPLVASRTD